MTLCHLGRRYSSTLLRNCFGPMIRAVGMLFSYELAMSSSEICPMAKSTYCEMYGHVLVSVEH